MALFGNKKIQALEAQTAELTAKTEELQTKLAAAESSPGQLDMPSTPSNFQPISGAPVNVSLINWHRACAIQSKLLQANGLHRRLHNAIRNYAVGKGLEIGVKALEDEVKPYEAAAKWAIDRFWKDPQNNMDVNLHTWIFEHSAYGEICLPAVVNEFDGSVVLQSLPVTWINNVKLNPRNILEATKIGVQQGTWVDNKRGGKMKWDGGIDWLEVIRYDNQPYVTGDDGKPILTEELVDLRPKKVKVPNQNFGMLSGDVFYFRSGMLMGSSRGWGDTMQVMDWSQAFDQGIYDGLNRYDIQSSVLWDCEVDGSQADIDKWQGTPIPTGAKLMAHNKKVKITPLAPAIQLSEFVTFVRTLRELIAGSVGFPEYALGYGGDTNVATATEQAPVMYAEFDNRRNWWKQNLRMMLRFVLEQANKAEMLYESDKNGLKGKTARLSKRQLDLLELQVNFLGFERNDTQDAANYVSTTIGSMKEAEMSGYLSKQTASKVVRQAVQTSYNVETDEQIEDAEEVKNLGEGTGASGNPVNAKDLIQSLGILPTKKPNGQSGATN